MFGYREIISMKKSPLPMQNACGGSSNSKSNSNSNSKNTSLGKEALVKLLRWHFGHPEFRGKQLDAIEAVLSGTHPYMIHTYIHSYIHTYISNI